MEKTNIITEILEDFKIFDGNYKREQVDAAIELKEEVAPFLIEILENVLADPDTYIENDERYDHIYALMLLGHFRDSKAHNVIIDLFSLPDDILHELFEDLTTSDLPTILMRTCGGSIERIRSLASNKDADDYCRVSALNAMAYAAVEGTDDDIVRGKIDSDRDGPDYERRPLLVIDGKEISWGEFGRMLITYEGFSFKLEIFDSSDEIL